MNIKRIVNISIVITLILVAGLAAIPASANAPQQLEIPFYWSGRIDNPCGFKIQATSIGTQRSTFWYDDNGQLVAGHNNFSLTETWEAGGNTLEFSYNYSVHGQVETYPEYYVVWLGIYPSTHVILPGSGADIKYAGYDAARYEMNKKGELVYVSSVIDLGVASADWAPLCEYFEQ